MSFTGGTSDSGKYVCADCIGDFVVTAEIEAGGRRRKCSYCKEVGRAVAIEQLADRVEEVYPVMVGEVETTPYFQGDSDKVEYRQNGDTPNTILSEMLECADDEIADDLVSELSSRHSYAAMKDGENNIYDDSNDIYTSYIPRSKEVAQTWASFCESIKHNRRFFNDTASDLLAEILEPILNPKLPGTKSAVKTIEPDSDERFIFRGRLANTVPARSDILAKPINMLGAPPKHLNAGGRMNAAGIPVFYGSFDVKTCVAELRGPVGGTAVVGKFEMLRPLRVLDLTLLQNAMFNISYFDPDVIQKFSYNHFLRGFHKEIKRAVIPGSEMLDYLPTQFVAEYLWTKAEPPLDGLIFGSAQISNAKAKNIAIFPHASVVEGWYEELHPKNSAAAKPKVETSDSFSRVIESVNLDFETAAAKEHVPDASLRLVKDATVIADVRSIDYTLKTRSASIYEMDMEYAGYEDNDYEGEDEEEDAGEQGHPLAG
jgi:hypothetical protein